MLALREQGRAELARKLSRPRAGQPGPEPELVARVLDELQAQGLLDEQRFASSLARRVGQRNGSLRVLAELRGHGLAEPLLRQALADAEAELEPELDRALRLLRKHHAQPATDAAERARQMRFLQRRGFDSDTVRQALRAHAGDAAAQHEDEDPA